MRKIDKLKQIEKANIMFEQRHIKSLTEDGVGLSLNDKVAEMIELSKIDDYALQLKKFYESFGVDDALDVIVKLKGLLDRNREQF